VPILRRMDELAAAAPIHPRVAFGAALRAARVAQGLTQENLAARSGLHLTYVNRAENGRVSPSLDAIVLLARAVGLAPSELVRRAEAAITAVPARPERPDARR